MAALLYNDFYKDFVKNEDPIEILLEDSKDLLNSQA